MKAIFAANRKVVLADIAEHLVTQLAGLPMEATVLLRGPQNEKKPPQPFELLTAGLCDALDIEVEWVRPETRGREGVFDRDWRMIRAADRLVAYIGQHTPTDAGTHHLIECAAAEEIEATAFYQGDEYPLIWLGGT